MPESKLEKKGPSDAEFIVNLLILQEDVPKPDDGRYAWIDWLTAVIGNVYLVKEKFGQHRTFPFETKYKDLLALKDKLIGTEPYDPEHPKITYPDQMEQKELPVSQEHIDQAQELLAAVALELFGLNDQSLRM